MHYYMENEPQYGAIKRRGAYAMSYFSMRLAMFQQRPDREKNNRHFIEVELRVQKPKWPAYSYLAPHRLVRHALGEILRTVQRLQVVNQHLLNETPIQGQVLKCG